jgi:hypothetical protein
MLASGFLDNMHFVTPGKKFAREEGSAFYPLARYAEGRCDDSRPDGSFRVQAA